MKKIILTYLSIFILFTFVFLALLRLPIPNFQPVLFYRGLIFLAATTAIFLLALAVVRLKNICPANAESLIAAILVSASLHLSLFVVFPVTFERSITTYLLNTLEKEQNNQNCQGLTYGDLEQKLVNEYIIQNKALEKRINEQKVIGFIGEDEQCVQITPKASGFLNFSEIVKRIYDIR